MTIYGKKKIELTRENILKLITQYDIYRLYMPNKWELNKVCHSPFRRDNEKSFIIGTKFGEITHKDFADSNIKGNCFSFVQQLLQCNYIEALRAIDRDFSLGISTGTPSKHTTIVTTYEQPIIEEKQYSNIQCITRKFTNSELQYWNSYHQDISILKKENIFSIKSIYLNKEKYSFNENDMRFGYLYEDKWKIYFPFQKASKKWLSNVPLTHLDGKEDIKDCDVAWIGKSKKDRLVLKLLYPHVTGTQNESRACFSQENIDYIKSNSNKQVLIYDNDKAGTKACKLITQELDMDYFNINRNYISDGISDPSDLVKMYDIKTLEKQLIKKGLL